MLLKLIVIILCALGGGFFGASSGIGLFPLYGQPKNLKIQIKLTIIGLIILAPTIYIIFKYNIN